MTNEKQEPIGDAKFSCDLTGMRAVILFPALVTPCLVKDSALMTVVVAVHKDHIDDPKKKVLPSYSRGELLPVDAARKFHSHFSLTPWNTPPLDDLKNDAHALSCFREACGQRYMIYQGHGPMLEAHKKKLYKAWFLQKMPTDGETLLSLYDHESERLAPFGVLHDAAVCMYSQNGYEYIFQLNFGAVPHREQGLHELSWLYVNHDAMCTLENPHKYEAFLQSRPGDDLLTKMLEEGMKKEEKTETYQGTVVLTEQVIPPINPTTGNERLLPASATKSRPGIVEGKPAHINEYHLRSPGRQILVKDDDTSTAFPYRLKANDSKKTELPVPQKETHVGASSKGPAEPEITRIILEKEDVAFMTQQNAPLLRTRHPVYFSSKEELTIGTISDLHVSSRQTLYKFVAAQTIYKADPKDSPYIGPLAHDNLQSTRHLLFKIKEQADIIAVTGDLYDHTRNCDPKACLDKISTTGDLWKHMDYGKNMDNEALYPPHNDGLMVLSLILESYAQNGKPVFFISGNHEAYQHPYGTSPRVFDTALKANAGIPADMNLTFYEATLLYGENFHRFVTPSNFTPANMNWLYAAFTPWKDCLVPYGKNKNYLYLGWGEDEDIPMIGEHLPRASEALSENQLTLLNHIASTAQTATNFLFSHFPIISFADRIPMVGGPHFTGVNENSSYTLGTVEKRHRELISLLLSKNIHYSISGHSHRPGVYQFASAEIIRHGKGESSFNVQGCAPASAGDALVDWREQVLPQSRSAIALVCGSSGPYGRQNLHGEFLGYGMEKPQGLLLNPAEQRVSFVKSDAAKPRLAVLLDYLWCDADIAPFIEATEGAQIYCRDHKDVVRYRPNPHEPFVCKLNPQWINILGGNPFAEITLHAVSITEERHTKSSASFFFDGSSKKNQEYTIFSFKKSDMERFFTRIYAKKNKSNEVLLYFSIKLQDTKRRKLSYMYNITYPWCFPVRYDFAFGMHGFKRNISGERYGYEVPDFEIIKKLKEYSKDD